jgi:UDP-GlcNAc:undecaprenyl-phosphate/decaprenyl-phosphate GlcNAc-1-phosphate transferase
LSSEPIVLLLAGLTAFAVTVVAILLLDGPAHRWGLVARPCARKRHVGVVPLTGGLGIALGVAASAWMLPIPWFSQWTLGAGILVLLVIGVLDDRYALRAYPRLLAQMAVATMMVAAGVQVSWLGNLVGLGEIGLGVFGGPLSILAIALMINAVNMMDGMDGLSGSIVFVALGGMSIIALTTGQAPLGWTALLLMAALAGFLVMNLRFRWRARAHAFLGDSGSMALGFALAWLAVSLAGDRTTGVAPITVAWLLLLPAADCLAVFIRRLRWGRNPLSADRSHLHHILLRAGFSVRATWWILVLNQLALVGIGVGCHLVGCPQPVLFVLAAMVMLGYIGFSLQGGQFLRAVRRARRPLSVPTESAVRLAGGNGLGGRA